MTDATTEWMIIGVIVGAFGVRGEMKVDALTDFPERFESLDRVYVGPAYGPRAVRGVRVQKGRILLQLEGIDTPEAVGALRGRELAIPRIEAVALPEGHFFLEDAIGIDAETTDGKSLGRVTDVLRTGGNEVFVLSGGLLVPSVRDAVAELDIPGRRLVVEPWVTEPPV